MTDQIDLDRIDYEILGALQNDARLSNKELAAQVGLAPSSCLARVRKLREAEVLRGFHADVDTTALGIGLQALTAIRLTQHARHNFTTFLEHVTSLDEVIDVFQLAGNDDYLLHVAVRDANHLRDFVLEKITTRPEVAHLNTSLIFRHMRSPTLPHYP